MAENKWNSKEEYERWKAGARNTARPQNDNTYRATEEPTIQCPNCKYEGAGKYFKHGSGCFEIILWLLGILPGLLYHLWRSNNSYVGCPQCDFRYVVKKGGHYKDKSFSAFTKFLIAVLVVLIGVPVLIGMCSHKSTATKIANNNATPSTPPAIIAKSEPILELQDWHWQKSETGHYVTAEGTIKNISSESQDSVTAVMQIYTKDNVFITSNSALIEYRPIMPGQTSPFSVSSPFNPEMDHATISFKKLMGGTISVKKKAEERKDAIYYNKN